MPKFRKSKSRKREEVRTAALQKGLGDLQRSVDRLADVLVGNAEAQRGSEQQQRAELMELTRMALARK